MTKPLLVILLLLPLSVSAGELDGKGIVCEKLVLRELPSRSPGIYGWVFGTDGLASGNRGISEHHQIRIKAEEVTIWSAEKKDLKLFDVSSYSESLTRIKWWEYWELDRATLLLWFTLGPEKYHEPNYQCQVADNRDVYYEVLENYRLEFQERVNAYASDIRSRNKI